MYYQKNEPKIVEFWVKFLLRFFQFFHLHLFILLSCSSIFQYKRCQQIFPDNIFIIFSCFPFDISSTFFQKHFSIHISYSQLSRKPSNYTRSFIFQIIPVPRNFRAVKNHPGTVIYQDSNFLAPVFCFGGTGLNIQNV